MSILGTHSTQGPVTPQQYAAHVNGRLVTWRDYLDISFHDLKSGLSVQWSIDPVLIKCLQAMPDGYVIAFMDEDCSFHIYAPPDDALFRPGEPIHVVSNPPIAKFCLDAEMTLYGPNRFTVRPSDIYVYSGPDPRYKCFCDVCFISPGGGVIVLHKILGRRDNGTGEWFQETLSVSRDLPLVSEDVLHSQMLPGGDRLLYWSDDKTHSILQFYMARIAEPSKSYGGILYHCNPQSTCRPGDLVWWAVSVCAFTGRVCVANREKGVLEVLDFVTAAPEAEAIAKQCQHSGQLRKGSIFHRVTHKLVKGFHRKVGATS
ncbi:hypothetical protein DL96DRAFT_1054272 [Flagelloscypha sp. PMI_526]|nr:hypothetical protein DL96DRAFT_1054272 [Flagelloscypha sp. PMI_526]